MRGPNVRRPRSHVPSARSDGWLREAPRTWRRAAVPPRPVRRSPISFPAGHPSGLLVARRGGPAAERTDQSADRTEEDGAQNEICHRPAKVPQGGWLQGRLDLSDLCRLREVPDPLWGGPALLAFLSDLRAYLVDVGDD